MSKTISVTTIDQEIKIIGLSYQKLGLPATVESLEKMWDIYGNQYRGKINNAMPGIDYGVNACLSTDIHEYIAGCAVTEIGPLHKDWTSYVIPPGRYIKYACRKMSELFENENHRDMRAWAEANGLQVNPDFMVEVYPAGAFDDEDVEVYLLFPIQESENILA